MDIRVIRKRDQPLGLIFQQPSPVNTRLDLSLSFSLICSLALCPQKLIWLIDSFETASVRSNQFRWIIFFFRSFFNIQLFRLRTAVEKCCCDRRRQRAAIVRSDDSRRGAHVSGWRRRAADGRQDPAGQRQCRPFHWRHPAGHHRHQRSILDHKSRTLPPDQQNATGESTDSIHELILIAELSIHRSWIASHSHAVLIKWHRNVTLGFWISDTLRDPDGLQQQQQPVHQLRYFCLFCLFIYLKIAASLQPNLH